MSCLPLIKPISSIEGHPYITRFKTLASLTTVPSGLVSIEGHPCITRFKTIEI